MERDFEAEHRKLVERLKAARDRMVRLGPAHNVTPETIPMNTMDEVAAYDAAKAEYDAIIVEAEALNNERAGPGE